MPVRVGLIGCGKITERLALPQLTGCAEARVSALVDVDRRAAQHMAERFGLDARRIWTDWRMMLRQAEVEAVGVCVPNDLHREVVMGCCEAKKHVMVEKPIARTLEEADDMLEAARRASVWLMVEQTQRFDPVHETAKDLVEQGAIGRVTAVHGRIGHAGPEYWSDTSPWFTDKSRAGGGVLIDVGIHIVDVLRWLSGKTVRRVCAVTAILEKPWDVEDNAVMLLEFSDGTLGSCSASWTTRPYELTTTLIGEQGTLTTMAGRPSSVVVRKAGPKDDPNVVGETLSPEIPAASRVGGAYPYFVRCILADQPPALSSGDEARASLEVVAAAYRSAQEGRWVDLPLS